MEPRMTERDLRVRLQEYATSIRHLPPQLEGLLPFTSNAAIMVPGDTAIKDAIRMYTLIADDLEKILQGEELKPFLVEGSIG
jgi:hypothetical protein